MNADDADFIALSVEISRRLVCSLTAGADSDNNSFRVGCAAVIENMMFAPRDFSHVRHNAFDNVGKFIVIVIDGLANLEINVGISGGAAHNWMVGIERVSAEFINRVIVQNLGEVGIINHFYLLNFMRRSEAVEEVNKGNSTLNRRQMRHSRQVHNFLNARFGEHSATCLPRRHNVLMVTKNAECRSRQRPRRYMKDARQHFARDFVQIGNHEQKALRRGVSSGQSSRLQ